jgi:3-methyl-2-oxobutanoate hydroxymethyltransferase
MISDAKALVAAGADFILLECVPSELAAKITEEVDAPVIGIGAGKDTDGQVLVVYDMLGLNPYKLARFVKNYMAVENTWQNAIQSFVDDVKQGRFPAPEHSFE